MKTYLAVIFAAVGSAALAGATENVTGCATVPVEGTNYTVRADVTCALSTYEGGDTVIIDVVRALAEK